MSNDNPTIRRPVFACDIVRYSRHDEFGQEEAQEALHEVLVRASADARLDREQWGTQDQGDGELVGLPPGLDEAQVIAEYFAALRNQLYQYNRKIAAPYRLRLRFAVHQGNTRYGAKGFVGDAPVHVSRILDAPEAKRALRDADDADIALIVSSTIYEEVIKQDRYEPRAKEFRKITVDLPDKGFREEAWIHLPTRTPPQATGDHTPEPEAPRSPGGPGDQHITGPYTITATRAAGRDYHEHGDAR